MRRRNFLGWLAALPFIRHVRSPSGGGVTLVDRWGDPASRWAKTIPSDAVALIEPNTALFSGDSIWYYDADTVVLSEAGHGQIAKVVAQHMKEFNLD